jgi:hypothetical protein
MWMSQTQAKPKRTIDRSRVVAGAIVIVLILAPALAKLIFYPAYPGSDDAFIHMAVAEHILDGEGWGIVSNDRVNLSSSPIFTVLLLPVLAMGSIGLAQILSLGFACAAMAITFFATRTITASNMCGLAALVVAAASVHLWRWSGTVMEASLGYLSVTVIAAATLRLMQARHSSVRNLALLGALIGLGTQVRFEIGIFLPLSMIALWFSSPSGRQQIAAVVGGFIVAVLPWIVFATAYFGTPIPTTFFAKASSLHIVNISIVKSLGTVVATGFGVSILIAAIAIALASRSVEGRTKLREYAIPLLFLVGWPLALFAFYYIKTDGLQSAARYFLPGMATWPIAVGLIISAVPRKRQYRPWLTAALVGCLAVGFVINVIRIQPVLTAFNGGYRAAMTHGAEYLRDNCKPGDVALIDVDIGIMARDGIGHCTLVDGGALATPHLRGMTLAEKLSRLKPTYLVQSTAPSRNALATDYPQLTLQMSESYTDHGVANAGQHDYLNIYRVNTH